MSRGDCENGKGHQGVRRGIRRRGSDSFKQRKGSDCLKKIKNGRLSEVKMALIRKKKRAYLKVKGSAYQR